MSCRTLTLFPADDVRTEAVLAVARRNLVVHNRGVINRRFIQSTGSGDLGKLVPLHGDVIRNAANNFSSAVAHCDEQLVQKFGLVADKQAFVLTTGFGR